MPSLPIEDSICIDLLFQEDPTDEAEPVSCSAGRPEKAQSTSSKPEANSTSTEVDGNYLYHLDFCTGIMTKKTGDQALVAEMASGPDGFAAATCQEGSKVEVKQTEMSNLQSKAKAKAKGKPLARLKLP